MNAVFNTARADCKLNAGIKRKYVKMQTVLTRAVIDEDEDSRTQLKDSSRNQGSDR